MYTYIDLENIPLNRKYLLLQCISRTATAVARTLIGGGGVGVYSYIHVLPD